MEIYGTIHFKLILPHIPGFQQEPLPAPVCSHSPDCKDCPYPRHGFFCWGADGTCLRSRMNEIMDTTCASTTATDSPRCTATALSFWREWGKPCRWETSSPSPAAPGAPPGRTSTSRCASTGNGRIRGHICRKAERKTNYEYCNKTDHAGT